MKQSGEHLLFYLRIKEPNHKACPGRYPRIDRFTSLNHINSRFSIFSWRLSSWKKLKVRKDDRAVVRENSLQEHVTTDDSLDAPAKLALAMLVFTNPTFFRDINSFFHWAHRSILAYQHSIHIFPQISKLNHFGHNDSHRVINSPSPLLLYLCEFFWQ